jgi:hypothetical protein
MAYERSAKNPTAAGATARSSGRYSGLCAFYDEQGGRAAMAIKGDKQAHPMIYQCLLGSLRDGVQPGII